MPKKISKRSLETNSIITFKDSSGKKIVKVMVPVEFQVGSDSSKVTKGATVYGGIVLKSGAVPANTSYRLYNENGSLKFDGSDIGGAGGSGDAVGWFSGSSATHGSLGIQPNWISTSGSLAISGTLEVAEYVKHSGDSDTYIRLQPNNVNIVAGGSSAIKLDLSNSKIQLNNTNSDLDVQIMADNGEVILHSDAGTNRVGIGTATPKTGFVDVQDYNSVAWTSQLSDGESGGHILKYGAGSTSTGQLYYMTASGDGGTWSATDADSRAAGAYHLLGIAIGSSPTSNGMLLRGYARISSTMVNGTVVPGAPVYVSRTSGEYDFSRPGGSGNFIRIVGYCLGKTGSDILLYFNPDTTWVEIS